MPLIPPTNKIDVTASLTDDFLDQNVLRTYAAEVGVFAYVWNNLHITLMGLLTGMLYGPYLQDRRHLHHYELIKAIWHSIKSDTGQRDILRSVAKAELNSEPYILDEVLWALDEIDRLARNRNDAIHVAVTVYGQIEGDDIVDKIGVDDFSGPPRAHRLKNKDLSPIYTAASLHALSLGRFVQYLWNLMYGHHDSPQPWPERPSLPDVLRDPSPPKNNQRRIRTKRKRQPESSQE